MKFSPLILIIFFGIAILLVSSYHWRMNRMLKSRAMNYLFIGTKADIASMNIAKHLLQQFEWRPISTEDIWRHNQAPITVPAFPTHMPPSSVASTPTYQMNTDHSFFYTPTIFAATASTSLSDRFFFWIVDHRMLELNFPNVIFSQLLRNYFFPSTAVTTDSSLTTEEEAKEAHRKACNIQQPEDLAIDQVFFVSRHFAASGTVSLTVHPIGLPHLPECGRSGGIAGRCSPPNPHIGNIYRAILQETKDRQLDQVFSITLEATHHGPFVEVPACFIEIGSTPAQWENPIAGETWATCLGKYFGFRKRPIEEYHVLDDYFQHLDEFFEKYLEEDERAVREKSNHDENINNSKLAATTIETTTEGKDRKETVALNADDDTIPPYLRLDVTKGVVLFVIGGGHYVPRMNDMARFGEEYHVGHALASYCLDKSSFELPSSAIDTSHLNSANPELPLFEYPYQRIIHEAIHSMRVAYPSCRIACLVDKKSFREEERQKIITLLEQAGIFCGIKTAEIRKFNLSNTNP